MKTRDTSKITELEATVAASKSNDKELETLRELRKAVLNVYLTTLDMKRQENQRMKLKDIFPRALRNFFTDDEMSD